ncbi:unnamed protein product [Clonostachys rosea]|uniref:FAD dependent oxidoreductase domain-containing protein n=1 Tax=Bionectria ochroleuca TaxID=29856 RepID=A0ABY6UNT3_BIOOC|nr:unnamed protein product [Clonostachys rosea]
MAPSEKDLPDTIRRQLLSDPELPRPNPTVSLWQEPPNPFTNDLQSTALPEKVDFLLIGSGVAACGVTRSLLSNAASGSKTVAVVEARGLCSGATGRNGGQLTRLPPTRYTFMRDEFGPEQAAKIMRLTVKGLDEMHGLAEEQGPELVAKSKKTRLEKFFAYYDEQSWNETKEAIGLYEKEVPEDWGVYRLVSREDTASVYGLNGAYGGLRFPAGTVSPYQLVTGTFKTILEKYPNRLTIATHTPVTAISKGSNQDYPYVVKTPRGTILASHVVHCTNGHAAHLLPGLRGKMYPRRGTMSVQSPGGSFPDRKGKQSWSFYFTPKYDKKQGAVETGRYYSFQHRDTGDLWVGGDKDSIDGFISADDSKIDPHADKNLRSILPVLFSNAWIKDDASAKGVWTGIMCYTGDQLPFVGKLPQDATGRAGSGEWIAAGWNTYGMTNGLISGDALGKLILGEDISSWFPEAYAPTEKRLSGPKFQTDAVLKDYFDRIGAHEVKAKL